MKTPTALLLLLVPVLSFSQNPDDSDLKRNVLKIAPQQFAVKSLKIGVERFNSGFNKSYSLYLTFRKEKSNELQFPAGYDGLGGEFQYRTYLKPLASYQNRNGKGYHQGIYLSGYVQGNAFSGDQFYLYSYVDPTTGGYFVAPFNRRVSIGNWGTGFTIGLQSVLWEVVTLDAYVGGGFQWSDVIGERYGPPPLNYDPEYSLNTTYNYSDPEFQGVLPKAGIHIGIRL
ncbi:MAG TPA: hypothetical protein DIS90_13850 [Cytophagales bacterium]|nr:hypothetical protein [Cytophagales bacterium]